jgi:arylsulfatase A-like enzyme
MKLQRMVRVGDYKLIVYPQAYRVRLFNLKDDPAEMNDLAGDAGQWPRIKDMFGTLMRLQSEMEDSLDLRPYFPQLVSNG